ncbi:MAG: TRAP transporter substrate-binding protein DctP [Deltaproteobacteria bacterium]|nr:TRAP transporter substrate-binding protein DctP [Deltaproteobacteria bacterium]
MKKLHLIPIVLLISLLSCSMFVSLSWGKSKPVVLRLGMAVNAETPQSKELTKLAERFTKRAGPDYSMEYYSSQTLVPFPESLDAVRTGAAEMMGWPPSAFSGDDSRLGAAELPFITNSPEGNSQAAKQLEAVLNSVLEETFNQKVLGSFSVSSNELISKKPVKKLEDWKGLLVQSLSPQITGIIKALGGSPVSIPFPDAYQSLEKGVVDAVIVAPSGMYSFKLQEVASYITTIFMCPGMTAITINMDVWNKMPKNIRDILVKEVRASTDRLNKELADAYWSDLDRLKADGAEIYALPREERDKWKKTVQPFTDKLLEKMREAGQKTLQIADDVNKQYPYSN